ncbi:MAG: hypothetical protein EOO07_03340 [Chitinophagaceae bacterium]|nr:MAG: hypothetical protein EOO07_03340 [Chitinophagaceae bacterium]
MDSTSSAIAAQPVVDSLNDICFYCGLPFEPISLSVNDPLYKRFSKYGKKTTQRFYLPGILEEENEPQFVLAHSWCNITAKRLLHDGRLALKESLTREVHEQKSPPWQHTGASKADGFQKRIQKQQLKETLSQTSDQCYYCGMPFDIVPVEPSQPLYRKLKMWARKVLLQSDCEFGIDAALAH